MKNFFATKLGHQTIAGIITVLAFPFLYKGGTDQNFSFVLIGIALMLIGMLSTPVINAIHKGKNPSEKGGH